jgi:two-component system OmpR family sensor kinase
MADDGPRAARRVALGIRGRVLVWFIAILSAATIAAVLVTRQILIAGVDARIDEALVQEAEELRRLSRGRDPRTGEPFGNEVSRIFEVFLNRNLPVRNEMFLTFLDGEPYRRSVGRPIYALDRNVELVERFGSVTESDRDTVVTPAGEVEYLAVPVRADGRVRGVFVAAIFREQELADVVPALWGAAGVGLATLVIGSLLAWRVTEGVLRRVATVTDTAGAISSGELTRRIEVRGSDEISRLADTFNEMLDRLEEAFRLQRQFVDDAGHELRTPITIVRGHLETIEDDPEERRETIALVLDELDRMNRMVNDLLVLAKSQQVDFLDLDTVDVGRLTDDLYAKARALAPRTWRLEEVGRGVVVADRQRLTQAMMQLAQNATEHTLDGEEVAIGSEVARGRARMWVRDSGPGIDPEDQGRIFRRFTRSGDGRGGSSGAGLGLAIVLAIAEAHHGTVSVESSPGEGATFVLEIPVDQPVVDGPEVPIAAPTVRTVGVEAPRSLDGAPEPSHQADGRDEEEPAR